MKTYYMADDDGNIISCTKDPGIAERYGFDRETDREIVHGYNGKLYFEGEAPERPVTFDDYDRAMEAHLDAEKAERGYTKREPSDYKDSSNPRWAQDAVDWIAHRDEVMAYGLEVENKAKRGEPVPTLDEFKTALPRIVWTFADEEEGAE